MNPLTPDHLTAIRQAIGSLPDDVPGEAIERTARRLERICYQPFLIRQPADFLRITKERLLAFIDDLVKESGPGNLSEQDLNLLLHQYRFLRQLRQDAPNAWDEISELWEED